MPTIKSLEVHQARLNAGTTTGFIACPVCLSFETSHFACVDGRNYWRCQTCEATYLDPDQLPNEALESGQYRLHRNEVNDAGYRAFLSRLAEPLLAKLTPGLSGLDYGCGPGPALAAMLTEAGQRMAVFDPLFFNEPAQMEKSYDFITCSEVVEHFHRPAEEFARLQGLLKPGGWLAVMTCFQTDDAAFASWHYRRDPTHVVFYRESTFQWIARHYGWCCEIPCANVALMKKALSGT